MAKKTDPLKIFLLSEKDDFIKIQQGICASIGTKLGYYVGMHVVRIYPTAVKSHITDLTKVKYGFTIADCGNWSETVIADIENNVGKNIPHEITETDAKLTTVKKTDNVLFIKISEYKSKKPKLEYYLINFV